MPRGRMNFTSATWPQTSIDVLSSVVSHLIIMTLAANTRPAANTATTAVHSMIIGTRAVTIINVNRKDSRRFDDAFCSLACTVIYCTETNSY